MISHTFRRLRRTPVPALGILLFMAILSVVLCGLQKANDAELEKYNETYHTIPVDVAITNLSGTTSTNLDIPPMISEKFVCLGGYLTDLQKVCKHSIQGEHLGSKLAGITSFALSSELWAENGTLIEWKDGYSEDIFATNELVCLVPHSMPTQTDEETGMDCVELYFERMGRGGVEILTHNLKLRVAGTYRGGDGKTVYCPYTVCEQLYTVFDEVLYIQAMRATLKNNDDLEALRTESKAWFAEPNPLGEKTPYEGNEFIEDYYLFALDINDELLQRAVSTLQTSITTNRICTIVVLCLSAATGFLIGFLMVHSRKQEIALMRTMGTPNRSIYFGFALEQMLCVILGIALGGSYNGWHPADRLGILAGIYFVGLTVALQIFLHKNLLSMIKEDE